MKCEMHKVKPHKPRAAIFNFEVVCKIEVTDFKISNDNLTS